jgi:deoxycytidylate deaminase
VLMSIPIGERYLWFYEAIRAARRSLCNFQVGCVLEPTSVSSKSHSLVVGVNHRINGNLKSVRSMHAEMHALSRADPNVKYRAWVVRLNKKSGKIGLARPCNVCTNLFIKRGNVREVWYSINEYEFGRECFYR